LKVLSIRAITYFIVTVDEDELKGKPNLNLQINFISQVLYLSPFALYLGFLAHSVLETWLVLKLSESYLE
jgi:hypothetical protein